MTTKTISPSPSEPRLKNPQASPAAWAGMMALQQAVNALGLEPALLDLVTLRASQINGCAFCIDLHFRNALQRGERAERLYLLETWEEVAMYSARERAALRWTEALTRLSDRAVSDEIYAAARAEFSEAELLNLTLAIVAINGWNRFNVGFRVPPRATEFFKVSTPPARPAPVLASGADTTTVAA
jgi:AhpD family alkylhydroperoxidase